MSLFTATIFTAVTLIAFGFLFLKNPSFLEIRLKGLLRSTKASAYLFGLATLWFLWHIMQLGAADFGQYKLLLLSLFAAVAISSFFYVKDFLAVRGFSVLLLLSSQALLQSAYMQEPQSRLFLVFFSYASIILGLYLGTVPFKLRNYFEWLFYNTIRPKVFGSTLSAYGLLLAILALTY